MGQMYKAARKWRSMKNSRGQIEHYNPRNGRQVDWIHLDQRGADIDAPAPAPLPDTSSAASRIPERVQPHDTGTGTTGIGEHERVLGGPRIVKRGRSVHEMMDSIGRLEMPEWAKNL